MRCLLLLLFIFGSIRSRAGEDYIHYQQLLHRADEAILQNNLPEALLIMDSVYSDYTFVYARHCVKGLQLALKLHDDLRGARWLQRCLVQGVPVWMLRNNNITRELWQRPYGPKVIALMDSFRAVYYSRIDTNLRRHVSRMMSKDALRTRRINDGFLPLRYSFYALSWWRHNKLQAQEIAKITLQAGFPEERLIGLPPLLEDSVTLAPYMRREGINLVLQNREAFFMLLHYFSTKRPDMNELLLPQVALGNLPPMQYARLNDYLSFNTSSKRYANYHVHQPRHQENADSVNLRRARLGIYPAEYQMQHENRHNLLRKQGRLEDEIVFDVGA